MATGFVGRRADGKTVWLHSSKSTATGARVRDARWGDFLNIVAQTPDDWTEITWGAATYFLLTENVANQRPLEILFVDVGQGDGCIVVSSETGADERIMVVDAGQHGNMLGLIKWRFGKLENSFQFHAAVITHPDQDHYLGFRPIFQHVNAGFDHVYHNGIGERAGSPMLGPSDATGRFLTDVIETDAQMQALYAAGSNNAKSKNYGKLMRAAIDNASIGPIQMLSTAHGTQENGRCWMPGFAPSDQRRTQIEVIGPVPDTAADGSTMLRWFGEDIGSNARNDGKTKNGHSILLRLTTGDLSVLLGGDLNRPAEDHLLRHYSQIGANQPLADAVPIARTRLGADVLKCCHHGAADVTDEFLRAVDPFAFVVSSGDDESHAHPRPDLLGRLGKNGRGDAPLLLCTEILRSTREKGKAEDFEQLRRLDAIIDNPATAPADRETAREERSELQDHIERRNVGVYGAITLRSDGDTMEISFMLERPRGKQRWQGYRYVRSGGGEWVGA